MCDLKLRTLLHSSASALLLSTLLITTNASATEKINLLGSDLVKHEEAHSIGVDAAAERKLRDGDLGTKLPIQFGKNGAAEIVYGFAEKFVSPSELRLKTNGLENGKAKIEILVSVQSPTSGFKTLRVEPIKNSNENWQSFKFDQSAAKWIMIKVTPVQEDVAVSIEELEVLGHTGTPVTAYEFNETPASAFKVLESLTGSIDVSVDEAEKSLFADASDGNLDEWSFAEASLMSSGVSDHRMREKYLAQIDRLEQKARSAVDTGASPFKQGQQLLAFLHKTAFAKGYLTNQTDVSSVLDNRTFNCVSSATLYNILAARLGLDIRGIEVPDHAFSILYNGTNHADIETTTPQGFNPARNPAVVSEFQQKTGFNYLPDKHRDKRREFGATGMVAVTYYNHGVLQTENENYPAALANYFKALSLDSENKSAVKNIIFVLNRWSRDLIEKNQIGRAIEILETGHKLAPKDDALRHNLSHAWSQKVRSAAQSGQFDEALEIAQIAHDRTKDSQFEFLQAWLFTSQADAKIDENNWQDAMAFVDGALGKLSENAAKEVIRWKQNATLRWSNYEIKRASFPAASRILSDAITESPDAYRLKKQLGYLVQEWVKHTQQTKGEDEAIQFLISTAKQHADNSYVQNVLVSMVNRRTQQLGQSNQYEAAINVLNDAIGKIDGEYRLKKQLGYLVQEWVKHTQQTKGEDEAIQFLISTAKQHADNSYVQDVLVSMVNRRTQQLGQSNQYEAAINILNDAIGKIDGEYRLKKQLGYLVQEWVKHTQQTKGEDEAIQFLISTAKQHADNSYVQDVMMNHMIRNAQSLEKAGEYEAAIAVYQFGLDRELTDYRLKSNLKDIWIRWAMKSIDVRDWQAALVTLEKAHTASPDEHSHHQNIVYVAYEWSLEVAKSDGASAGEKIVEDMIRRFPNVTDLASKSGSLIANEAYALFKKGNIEKAEELAKQMQDMPHAKSKAENLLINIYFDQAKPHIDAGEWQKALVIFQRGYKKYPQIYKMRTNLVASWHQRAKSALDNKQWSKALELYRLALKDVPNEGSFSQNVRYVEHEMSK